MSLTLNQTYSAVAPNISVSFAAQGGTPPYVYSVRNGGCGGSIISFTGIYTAPGSVSENPATISDTVQVRDAVGSVATASVLVGTPILLLCDIIQNQMGLAQGRVYLWDQKIMQPNDDGLYVAVSVVRCKPFGNTIGFTSTSGLDSNQTITVLAQIDIDLISRGPAARDQKELVLMALNSVYAEQQQEANSFYISRISTGFINLSEIDGPAIPYRYKISLNMMYTVINNKPIPFFDTFTTPILATNP